MTACHCMRITGLNGIQTFELEGGTHNTTEHLSNLQMHNRLRREENRRESNNQRQASHNRISVSETFRDITVDKETNDFSHIGTLFCSG